MARALRDCGVEAWTDEDADRWWREQAPAVLERAGRAPAVAEREDPLLGLSRSALQ